MTSEAGSSGDHPVVQTRVVATTADFDTAVRFYRDTLGLPEIEAFSGGGGRGIVLGAGSATLEILDQNHAAYVDEVEVGRRVAGPIRIDFEVSDVPAITDQLAVGGAEVLSPPVTTPWGSLNSRLEAPGGLQLTLFGDAS